MSHPRSSRSRHNLTSHPLRLAVAALAVAALVVVAGAACTDAPERPSVDDPTVARDIDTVSTLPVAPPPPPLWRADEAGPVLLVPGRVPRSAALVLPDLTDSTLAELRGRDLSSLAPLEVDLFARRGQVGTARLADVQARTDASCLAWPLSDLSAPAGGLVAPWTVALAAGRARALPLDSIETMAPADSARLAADLTRLASTAPNDTAAAFRGLPFVVRTARPFTLAGDTAAVASLVVRRLGSEANPLAEHLFLVAERAPGARRWRLAHSERVTGPEETVETTEVLAALLLGPTARPSLVLLRDYGDGTTYALLERQGGRWTVRWSSAYTGGC